MGNGDTRMKEVKWSGTVHVVLEFEKVMGSFLSEVAEYSFFPSLSGAGGVRLTFTLMHGVQACFSCTCPNVHQCARERTHGFFLCTMDVYSLANPCELCSESWRTRICL